MDSLLDNHSPAVLFAEAITYPSNRVHRKWQFLFFLQVPRMIERDSLPMCIKRSRYLKAYVSRMFLSHGLIIHGSCKLRELCQSRQAHLR